MAWIICAVSVRPVALISLADSTSIGTGASITVRASPRVLSVETASSVAMARVSEKFAVVTLPAVMDTESMTVLKPSARTRTSYRPGGSASR